MTYGGAGERPGPYDDDAPRCPACVGTGVVGDHYPCSLCGGAGVLRTGADLMQPQPPVCPSHREVQHRDGRPAWCNRCGWRHAVPAQPAVQVKVFGS